MALLVLTAHQSVHFSRLTLSNVGKLQTYRVPCNMLAARNNLNFVGEERTYR